MKNKVKLPDVWKKSICYTCKQRNLSEGICKSNLVMGKQLKKCRSCKKEETGE